MKYEQHLKNLVLQNVRAQLGLQKIVNKISNKNDLFFYYLTWNCTLRTSTSFNFIIFFLQSKRFFDFFMFFCIKCHGRHLRKYKYLSVKIWASTVPSNSVKNRPKHNYVENGILWVKF